jgi:hypothetical protein
MAAPNWPFYLTGFFLDDFYKLSHHHNTFFFLKLLKFSISATDIDQYELLL